MGVLAGTAYIDVVPQMTGFGAKTAAGVESSLGGVKSKVAGIGKSIGLIMGGALLLSFGKKSLEAFDELEAASNRLEYGLEKIGQGPGLQGILDWSREFSIATGINQDSIVAMGSKLTVMGSAFFEALGPDAASWIEKITGGLTDMASATGKSAQMLMRSLGPSILNVPQKAIPMLQKFGALTDDQAQKVLDLVAAGKQQAATQLEITAIQEKYNGAAASTSTLTQRLGNYWNQFNIIVGRFIEGGMKEAVKLIGALPKPVRELAIALGLATLALTAFSFVMGSSFVASITAAIAGLVGWIGFLAADIAESGLATAATYALTTAFESAAFASGVFVAAVALTGLALVKLHAFLNMDDEMGQKWADGVVAGTIKLKDLQVAVKDVTGDTGFADKFNGDQTVLDAFGKTIEDVIVKLQETPNVLSDAEAAAIRHAQATGDSATAVKLEKEALQRLNATTGESIKHLNKLGGVEKNFAKMSNDAWDAFKETVAASTDSVKGSLDDFKKDFWKTVKNVIRGLDAQTGRLKRWANDVAVVTSTQGLTPAQKARLLAQPAEVVDAWVQGTDKQKAQITKQLKQQDTLVTQTQTNVDNLNTQLDTVVGHLSPVNAMWENLHRNPNLELQVSITASPSFPGGRDGDVKTPYPLAAGGIVTKPTTILAGEAGPEAIIPLSGRAAGPLTMRVLDWRAGIVELSRELDWMDTAEAQGW